MCIWVILLVIPPGSKAITSTYRLHFIHGLLSTFLAILYIWGKVPDYYPTMASASYFITDICNMLLNDFIYNVTSYQKGNNRVIEYLHHFLCGFVLIVLQYDHFSPQICSFTENPGPSMMLAELSTPFLIAWRAYPNVYMAFIFLIMFIAVRLVYHCGVYIPYLMSTCNIYVSILFCMPYVAIQIVFSYKIFIKILRSVKKMGKGKDHDDDPMEKSSSNKNENGKRQQTNRSSIVSIATADNTTAVAPNTAERRRKQQHENGSITKGDVPSGHHGQ